MKPKISFANTGNSYAIKAPMINSITPTSIRANSLLTRSKVTPIIIPGTTSVTKRHSGPSLIAQNQSKIASTSYASPYLQQKITTFDTSVIKPAPYLVSGPVYTKVTNVSTPTVPITYSTRPAYQLQYLQQYQQQPLSQYQHPIRPANQRLQNRRPQSRKEAPVDEQPEKPSSCCCLPLWILLGLLGLAGLILGLLYGLGVLGKGNTNTNSNTNIIPRNPEGIYVNPVPIQTVPTTDTDFKIPPPILGKIVPDPSASAYSNTGYQSDQKYQTVSINGQYTSPNQANSEIITSGPITTQPIIVSPTNQISIADRTTSNGLPWSHKFSQKIHYSQISTLHDY